MEVTMSYKTKHRISITPKIIIQFYKIQFAAKTETQKHKHHLMKHMQTSLRITFVISLQIKVLTPLTCLSIQCPAETLNTYCQY